MLGLGITLLVIGALLTGAAHVASKSHRFERENGFHEKVAKAYLGGAFLMIVGGSAIIWPYLPM